jgi:hypothetical protein
MKWQEYEAAIGTLYTQLEGIGEVRRDVSMPDKVTGQRRQVDVWLTLRTKGHEVSVLIDAKLRRGKVDVKDVEEVLSLGAAVGACKCVLVAANGWTTPAEVKARKAGLDLRLVTVEDALDLMVTDKWTMCPVCEDDCIVLDRDGATEVGGAWLWWLAGRCRECQAARVWCQDCGWKGILEAGHTGQCECGYSWRNGPDTIYVQTTETGWIPADTTGVPH